MICYCMSVSVTAIHWKFMTSKIKKMSVKQLIDGTTLHNLHPVHTVLLHNKKVAEKLVTGSDWSRKLYVWALQYILYLKPIKKFKYNCRLKLYILHHSQEERQYHGTCNITNKQYSTWVLGYLRFQSQKHQTSSHPSQC